MLDIHPVIIMLGSLTGIISLILIMVWLLNELFSTKPIRIDYDKIPFREIKIATARVRTTVKRHPDNLEIKKILTTLDEFIGEHDPDWFTNRRKHEAMNKI